MLRKEMLSQKLLELGACAFFAFRLSGSHFQVRPKWNLNVKVQDEDLMPGDAANPPPQVKASPLLKPKVIKKVTLAAPRREGNGGG